MFTYGWALKIFHFVPSFLVNDMCEIILKILLNTHIRV